MRRRRQQKGQEAGSDSSGAAPPFKEGDKFDMEQGQEGTIAAGNRSPPPGSGASGNSGGGTIVPASVPPSANDDAFSLESLRVRACALFQLGIMVQRRYPVLQLQGRCGQAAGTAPTTPGLTTFYAHIQSPPIRPAGLPAAAAQPADGAVQRLAHRRPRQHG